MGRPVAITGMGAVSCLGNDADALWRALRDGRPDFRVLDRIDTSKFRFVHGGQAWCFPADIGDGLRKRVAIARALTLEPKFAIFDEPTTGLDPMAAANVDDLIRSLRNDTGVTAIVVSHDLRSILTVADRIALIYEGNIRLDGTPTDFRTSTDPIVHQFMNGLPDGPMQI